MDRVEDFGTTKHAAGMQKIYVCWFITPKRRDSNQQFQGTIRLMVGLTSRISMNICFLNPWVVQVDLTTCPLVGSGILNPWIIPKSTPVFVWSTGLPGCCGYIWSNYAAIWPQKVAFWKGNPRISWLPKKGNQSESVCCVSDFRSWVFLVLLCFVTIFAVFSNV